MSTTTPPEPASVKPSYWGVFRTFVRNSLVRDMTFRTNFIIHCFASMSWTAMNFGFYLLIFQHTNMIGKDTGWGPNQFFVFLATTWFINSLVQTFFMPNAQEFSELIRTGNLDFALVKPIDTQFLISLQKVEWAGLANFFMGLVLLGYALTNLSHQTDWQPGWAAILLYPFYVACGVLVLYSLMISLAATSIWLGRNQSLYDFWFYITNFSRYPMEIYQQGAVGWSLWGLFTFVIPVLVVVNVPARLMADPISSGTEWKWPLAAFALDATAVMFFASRWIFRRALLSYRSASS